MAVSGGLTVGGIYLYPKWKAQAAKNGDSGKDATPAATTDPSETANQPQFPRRILGICVNNYLFANPTSYGYDPRGTLRRDFNALLGRFSDKLKIPRNQVYEL